MNDRFVIFYGERHIICKTAATALMIPLNCFRTVTPDDEWKMRGINAQQLLTKHFSVRQINFRNLKSHFKQLACADSPTSLNEFSSPED